MGERGKRKETNTAEGERGYAHFSSFYTPVSLHSSSSLARSSQQPLLPQRAAGGQKGLGTSDRRPLLPFHTHKTGSSGSMGLDRPGNRHPSLTNRLTKRAKGLGNGQREIWASGKRKKTSCYTKEFREL